jgi:hypothetical protein
VGSVYACVTDLRNLAGASKGADDRLLAAERRIHEFVLNESGNRRSALERLRDAVEPEAYKGPPGDTFWIYVQDFVDLHLSKLFEQGQDR